MIPTLNGRIQTRIFLLLFVGIPWTLIITPFLPNVRDQIGDDASLLDAYKTTFSVLGVVLVLAVFGWELLYHFLQQFRWEKDWPVMFTFFLVIPEAVVAHVVFKALDLDTKFPLGGLTDSAFWWHIVTTWMVMWLFVLGPIKVLFIRWRFSGGRIFF